jgi:hypothetical protein
MTASEECRGTFYEPWGMQNVYQDHTFQPFNYNKDKTSKWFNQCTLCHAKIYNKHYLPNHLCYTPIPELKTPIVNAKLFVFDLEAYQKLVEKQVNTELHVHGASPVCIRNIYSNDYRKHFHTIANFMAEILHNPIFHGAVILAHNGVSYDCQFILQYMEENLIPFEKLQ